MTPSRKPTFVCTLALGGRERTQQLNRIPSYLQCYEACLFGASGRSREFIPSRSPASGGGEQHVYVHVV